MQVDPTPEELHCAACGEAIDGEGYLPATDAGDAYDPHPGDAVCDACGFNDVGMMGCAPELSDVTDPGPDDVLLYVGVADDGLEVLRVKE